MTCFIILVIFFNPMNILYLFSMHGYYSSKGLWDILNRSNRSKHPSHSNRLRNCFYAILSGKSQQVSPEVIYNQTLSHMKVTSTYSH